MKHIKLLLILVLTTASSFAFSQWAEYNTQPQQIEKFSFVDDNIGYTISATNTTSSGPNMIYKTSDGGNSWTTIQLPLLPGSGSLQSIDFTAEGIGVISVFGTIQNTFFNYCNIYSTVDDGATWNDITPIGTGSSFMGSISGLFVDFANTDMGFVAESNTGILYRTIDGGASWDTTNLSGVHIDSINIIGPQFYIQAMDFFDENNGIISLSRSSFFMIPEIILLSTIDGGVTWENVNIQSPFSWTSAWNLVQASPSTAYASSYSNSSFSSKILRITDNGLSVDTISLPNDLLLQFQRFDFFDDLNGFVVLKNNNTDNCYLYNTNDGGDNWFINDSVTSINGSSIDINDLHLTNTTGYLSVSNYDNSNNMFLESFYKFEGGVGIPEIETRNSTIYPNPAVSGQAISWDSDRSINEVSIIDLNGKLISKRSINKNSMELPSLNTGMYFVQLMSNRSSETISLIIK